MNFRLDYATVEKKKKKKQVNTTSGTDANIAEERTVSIRNKRVVVTGAIPNMVRRQVAQWLTRNGATMHTAVVSTTDYLILGNTRGGNTTKMQAARRYGIPIVPYRRVMEYGR